jgi:DNA-binding Lrp family transcriptional regulator
VKKERETSVALKTEIVSIAEFYQHVWNLTKQLDSTTIRILCGIQKLGPRNLLAVARYTRIPFSTVYNRIEKLEVAEGPVSFANANVSKLGLTTVSVITTANPGNEAIVTEALKLPKYWHVLNRCEGGYTHDSVHYVPVKQIKLFQSYLREMVNRGLVAKNTVLVTGDDVGNHINYDYYDPKGKRWRYSWDVWLRGIARQKLTRKIEDPKSYETRVDRRDLDILRELQVDGRKTFVDLAKPLGITLQAVKYRFDRRLIGESIVSGFGLNTFPCPPEVAAYYELHCEFPNERTMNKFFSYLDELFFVIRVKKILKRNSLLLRAVILDSQVLHLFRFLSELCRRGILRSYCSVRIRLDEREIQPIAVELFDTKTGWLSDYKSWVAALRKLSQRH